MFVYLKEIKTWKILCKPRKSHDIKKMENLLLSLDEQKVVLKCKNILESKFKVRICLPEFDPSCEHDVVVANVVGGKINLVKKRMNQIKKKQEQRITIQNNVTTITLSDSDSDSSFPVLTETQQKPKKRRRGKKRNRSTNEQVDLSSTILLEDSEESANEDSVQKRPKNESSPPAEFIPLDTQIGNTVSSVKVSETMVHTNMKAESSLPVANSFSLDNAQLNENTSEHKADDSIVLCDSPPPPDFISLRTGKEKENIPNKADDSIILCDSPPPPDFISLRTGKKKENIPNKADDSVIIIDDEIPRPVPSAPRRLRPIVIDGSNVAREHGKVTNTYSCKGIKIAIDYFLQRGHEQVTAFVPHYRRHNKFGPVLTTDQPLLEELAKEQRVVFTPSRKIDNKRVTCYDDRFIVELATQTDGVILSNDNYRDIASENEAFKKTVHERKPSVQWRLTNASPAFTDYVLKQLRI